MLQGKISGLCLTMVFAAMSGCTLLNEVNQYVINVEGQEYRVRETTSIDGEPLTSSVFIAGRWRPCLSTCHEEVRRSHRVEERRIMTETRLPPEEPGRSGH